MINYINSFYTATSGALTNIYTKIQNGFNYAYTQAEEIVAVDYTKDSTHYANSAANHASETLNHANDALYEIISGVQEVAVSPKDYTMNVCAINSAAAAAPTAQMGLLVASYLAHDVACKALIGASYVAGSLAALSSQQILATSALVTISPEHPINFLYSASQGTLSATKTVADLTKACGLGAYELYDYLTSTEESSEGNFEYNKLLSSTYDLCEFFESDLTGEKSITDNNQTSAAA